MNTIEPYHAAYNTPFTISRFSYTTEHVSEHLETFESNKGANIQLGRPLTQSVKTSYIDSIC